MPAIEVILGGVILGGLYALVAIGFNLQFGMARIVNLAYGEFLMGAAFAAFFMFTLFRINPIAGMLFTVPVTFGANWLIYRVLMLPLVRRARTRDDLEGRTILATFGLLFVLRGAATLAFSADNRFYDYLGQPLSIFGFTFAANRVLAFAMACLFAAVCLIILNRTRFGAALRALSIDPIGAELVGIDVRGLCGLAFAGGGALVAAAGTLVSTFLTFNPAIGIDFTMKALVVVIMGGVGNMAGSLLAGILLGVAEALCSYYVDSGLTLAVAYALFLIVLVVRPRGLFGTP
ncbi:MAG TPA: branched-chain amino acid ABC transporter permease [Xanthobacteraceae bacterium]|nr:branched-chain amino acid ABC transporter permease [Xanthobacteraceae bacterium]